LCQLGVHSPARMCKKGWMTPSSFKKSFESPAPTYYPYF
jgi:hypothetical protein